MDNKAVDDSSYGNLRASLVSGNLSTDKELQSGLLSNDIVDNLDNVKSNSSSCSSSESCASQTQQQQQSFHIRAVPIEEISALSSSPQSHVIVKNSLVKASESESSVYPTSVLEYNNSSNNYYQEYQNSPEDIGNNNPWPYDLSYRPAAKQRPTSETYHNYQSCITPNSETPNHPASYRNLYASSIYTTSAMKVEDMNSGCYTTLQNATPSVTSNDLLHLHQDYSSRGSYFNNNHSTSSGESRSPDDYHNSEEYDTSFTQLTSVSTPRATNGIYSSPSHHGIGDHSTIIAYNHDMSPTSPYQRTFNPPINNTSVTAYPILSSLDSVMWSTPGQTDDYLEARSSGKLPEFNRFHQGFMSPAKNSHYTSLTPTNDWQQQQTMNNSHFVSNGQDKSLVPLTITAQSSRARSSQHLPASQSLSASEYSIDVVCRQTWRLGRGKRRATRLLTLVTTTKSSFSN